MSQTSSRPEQPTARDYAHLMYERPPEHIMSAELSFSGQPAAIHVHDEDDRDREHLEQLLLGEELDHSSKERQHAV